MNPSAAPFGIGIVGCGNVGRKRAHSLGKQGKLVACTDEIGTRAHQLAAETGASVYPNWQALLQASDVAVVVVATRHDCLANIALAAIQAGKHVLVEKPAARTAEELRPLLQAQKQNSVQVHVGYNHRYHKSLVQAKAFVDAGGLGELMFIRGRYGHGGRLGYEKEWRADPTLSGGGELIDQGSHLIDLSRWILGDFSEIQGMVHTYYWDMPVEDNAFMMLKTPKQQIAFLQASCTEWKNLFSMEIYGKKGKLDISGLGGSYGVERMAHFHLLPEMGPPETRIWEYPMADESWSLEMDDFLTNIRLGKKTAIGLQDAYEVLKIIQTIYAQSSQRGLHDHCS